MRVARETYVLLARFRDDTVKKQKGEPPGSPFCFSRGCLRISVAAKPCDDGGDACYWRACDGGDHARMLDWQPALGWNLHYSAKPIAWPMLAARTKTTPALMLTRGIERYVSRQISRVKSPVKLLNHRLSGKSSGIASEIVPVVSVRACNRRRVDHLAVGERNFQKCGESTENMRD